MLLFIATAVTTFLALCKAAAILLGALLGAGLFLALAAGLITLAVKSLIDNLVQAWHERAQSRC